MCFHNGSQIHCCSLIVAAPCSCFHFFRMIQLDGSILEPSEHILPKDIVMNVPTKVLVLHSKCFRAFDKEGYPSFFSQVLNFMSLRTPKSTPYSFSILFIRVSPLLALILPSCRCSRGFLGCAIDKMVAQLNRNRNNFHRIVAENIHHLHSDLVAPFLFVLVRDALEFQCAVFLRAERLPLVLEDVITRPPFFVLGHLC